LSGKGLRLGPAIWLIFNSAAPRRPIAVNPPWRLEGTRNATSARAAPWRVLRLRSAPSGWRRSLGVALGCKRSSRRRGSGLAKRNGATGEAGLALRRACLDGGSVFGDLRPRARSFW